MDSHSAALSDLHWDHKLVPMKADCLVTSLVGHLEKLTDHSLEQSTAGCLDTK